MGEIKKMNKLKITLLILICFSFSFLQGQNKYPFDIENTLRAISLYDESTNLYNEGKSVKSEKAETEAEVILNKIFTKGKIISSNDICYFRKPSKEERQIYYSSIYYSNKDCFFLVCKDIELNTLIEFEFITSFEQGFERKNVISESLLEKFEDIEPDGYFHAKIEIIKKYNTTFNKDNYIYDFFDRYNYKTRAKIVIYCKILSLTPIVKQNE